MKQEIEPAFSREGEESNTDSASKQLDSIDMQFGRAMRCRILENLVDSNEVPDCKRGTEVNWAPSGRSTSWISTSEYPVARRLLSCPDLIPFGLTVEGPEELRAIMTESYSGEPIYTVECHTAELSTDFEELVIDVLVDVAGEEPHSMVLTPDYWGEENHGE